MGLPKVADFDKMKLEDPMSKAPRSGLTVQPKDVPTILAMVARKDRRHDIAAWFGLNQGRIKETEDGKHGNPPLAGPSLLPPSGSPGIKARRLRGDVGKVLRLLKKHEQASTDAAITLLERAIGQFDLNE